MQLHAPFGEVARQPIDAFVILEGERVGRPELDRLAGLLKDKALPLRLHVPTHSGVGLVQAAVALAPLWV